jgi:hypothetical protein
MITYSKLSGFRFDKIRSIISMGCAVLLLAFMAIDTMGCGSSGSGGDSEAETEGIDLSGNWAFTVEVTAAGGVCSSEVGHKSTRTITITQTDAHVVLDGFLGVQGNKVEGTLDTGVLKATGTYWEDGGYTTSTHTLNVTDKDNMSGQEDWWWISDDGAVNCPGGKAAVTATRIP